MALFGRAGAFRRCAAQRGQAIQPFPVRVVFTAQAMAALMESDARLARRLISDIPKSKSSLISDNRNCYHF
jgi:hypothetical protein